MLSIRSIGGKFGINNFYKNFFLNIFVTVLSIRSIGGKFGINNFYKNFCYENYIYAFYKFFQVFFKDMKN